jgi:hypothetical protein
VERATLSTGLFWFAARRSKPTVPRITNAPTAISSGPFTQGRVPLAEK